LNPSSDPWVRRVSGTTVTCTAPGSRVIDANQAGNGTWSNPHLARSSQRPQFFTGKHRAGLRGMHAIGL
jgi:hypothetical protein